MELFDTDVLIEHFRGNEAGTELVRAAVADDQGACSVLTRFELLAGMRPDGRAAVRGLLTALVNVPVTPEIATQAGEWGRRFRESHAHVGAVDYVIGATADYLDAELLTRNIKHSRCLRTSGLRSKSLLRVSRTPGTSCAPAATARWRRTRSRRSRAGRR